MRRGEVETKATAIELETIAGLESLDSTIGAGEFHVAKTPALASVGAGNDANTSELTKFNKRLFERLLFGGPAQISYEVGGSGFPLFAINQSCEFP
jgi:hypothetical protein